MPKEVLHGLQMAQQQVERLWEEIQRLDARIEARDQELWGITEKRVIKLIKEEKAGLDQYRDMMWQQLTALQDQLAAPAGEVVVLLDVK